MAWLDWTLPFAMPLAALGVLGAIAGVVSLVAVRHRFGYTIAIASLAAATTCAGLGGLAVVVERGRVDASIASTAQRTGSIPTETQKLRAKRAGYDRARRSAQLGLIVCALPLFGGLFGVLAPMARRRRPRPMSMRMPRSMRSQVKFEWTTSMGVASLTSSALSLLAVGACTVAWTIPLPGPNLDANDKAWDARQGIDEIEASRLDEGCSKLTEACAITCDERKIPNVASATELCVSLRLDAVVDEGSIEARDRLDRLTESALPISDADRERVRTELAAQPSSSREAPPPAQRERAR
jgi:hypothetical protein